MSTSEVSKYGGCDPLPGGTTGSGYGVTKELPENYTNIYHGTYHGICHGAFL
jgi:hypothetical protein